MTDNVVKFFGPIEPLQAVLAHEPTAEFRMAAAAKPCPPFGVNLIPEV